MTKKLTFCSMMAVMGILSLLLSNILQSNTIFLYLLSTMFTYICVEEYGIKYGFLTYCVISLAGFILVANKAGITAYLMIVGYYPVVKHIIEHLNINKAVKWILKIVFVLVVSTVAFALLKQFLPFGINIAVVYVMGIAVFAVYDIVLTMGIKFYALRLRKLK